jgi:hypothetical protein
MLQNPKSRSRDPSTSSGQALGHPFVADHGNRRSLHFGRDDSSSGIVLPSAQVRPPQRTWSTRNGAQSEALVIASM